MPKTKKKETKKEQALHVELIKQMVTLSTSGLGLVAALAWNSVIQEFVNTYVKKWIPAGGGIISLLIYALIITTLAVVVTVQLSRLSKRIQK